jgi:phosphoribosylamine---glycine ligase
MSGFSFLPDHFLVVSPSLVFASSSSSSLGFFGACLKMGKKILLVGGGGREHALAWKIAQSPLLEKLYCAPGNAGIAQLAECVAIDGEDLPAVKQFVLAKGIDLVVIGPEGPLVAGLADVLREAGVAVFGPSKAAAAIEGSKSFMKGLFAKYNIPTAKHKVFTEPEAALDYIRQQGAPIVVKTSGLAAGKGAIVCQTLDAAYTAVRQIMVDRVFGSAGDEVVIEEFLAGEELSFIAFVDGENVLPLAGSQDHKAVGEGDSGLNTGGMGAYSPAPVLTEALHRQVIDEVMIPTVRAMAAEGRPFKGVLYAGLMVDQGKMKVLEFNARFGDPETQPLLMRMQSDIVPLMEASATGSLAGLTIEWDSRSALCVVMAAGGYPGSYAKGQSISGLQAAAVLEDVAVFHAGTQLVGEQVVTAGGRVLGVTALGDGVKAAQRQAYAGVDKIQWDDAYCRRDIGYRAVAREEK